MRILWFSNSFFESEKKINRSGGWLETLKNELIKYDKINLGYCYLSKSASNCQMKIDNLKVFPIVRFSNMQTNKKTREYLMQKCLEIIKDFSPDIIHIHGTESGFSDVISLTQIPCIVSIQGIIHTIALKLNSGLSASSIRQNTRFLDYFSSTSPIKKKKLFQRLLRQEEKCFKDCNYLIGRTQFDRYASSILAPQAKYFYNSEVLRPKFYDTTWVHHRRINLILITSINNAIYKGLEVVLYTLKTLLAAGIDINWKIIGLNGSERIVEISNEICKVDRHTLNHLHFWVIVMKML